MVHRYLHILFFFHILLRLACLFLLCTSASTDEHVIEPIPENSPSLCFLPLISYDGLASDFLRTFPLNVIHYGAGQGMEMNHGLDVS